MRKPILLIITLSVLCFVFPAPGQDRPPPAYEILPAPSAEEITAIRAAMGDREEHVWLGEDGTLHMAAIAAEGPVSVTGGVQRPLERVGDSDLWLLRLRRDGWDRAFLSYYFMRPDSPARIRPRSWSGPNAPADPRRAEDPEVPNRVETIEIESRHLGEQRSVTIVLPPGEHRGLPAIVMADGQGAEAWGKIVRAMIDDGKIRPVAIIGVHSGGYRGERGEPFDISLDYRAREYLERQDPERFAAHLRFVTEEVLPMAAERFGISTRREDLAVVGYSNGGAFAASAGLHAPERFGTVMAFSIGMSPQAPIPDAPAPRFCLAAGELEPAFLRGTEKTREHIRGWAEADMRVYPAGHCPRLWDHAMADYVQQLFPAVPAEPAR